MAPKNPLKQSRLPNPADPSEVADALEPEVVNGPLGVPFVKPSGVDTPRRLQDSMADVWDY